MTSSEQNICIAELFLQLVHFLLVVAFPGDAVTGLLDFSVESTLPCGFCYVDQKESNRTIAAAPWPMRVAVASLAKLATMVSMTGIHVIRDSCGKSVFIVIFRVDQHPLMHFLTQ